MLICFRGTNLYIIHCFHNIFYLNSQICMCTDLFVKITTVDKYPLRRKVRHVIIMSKRKIKVLSLSDKLKIVNAFECGKTQNEIQNKCGLPESTFYKIIKSKDSIKSQCSEGHGNIKRSRLSEFPDVEKCKCIFIDLCK